MSEVPADGHPCQSLYLDALEQFEIMESAEAQYNADWWEAVAWCAAAGGAATFCLGSEGLLTPACFAMLGAAASCANGKAAAENSYNVWEQEHSTYLTKLEEYNECLHENKESDETLDTPSSEPEGWEDPDGYDDAMEFLDEFEDTGDTGDPGDNRDYEDIRDGGDTGQ